MKKFYSSSFYIFLMLNQPFVINASVQELRHSKNQVLFPEFLFDHYATLFPSQKDEIIKMSDIMTSGDSILLMDSPANASSVYKEGLQLALGTNHDWLKILFYNRLGFANYMLKNIVESSGFYSKSIDLIQNSSQVEDTVAGLEALYYYRYLNGFPTPEKIKPLLYPNPIIAEDFMLKDKLRRAKYQLLVACIMIHEFKDVGVWQLLDSSEELFSEEATDSSIWLFLTRFYKGKYFTVKRDWALSIEYYKFLFNRTNKIPRLSFFRFEALFNLGLSYNETENFQASIECMLQIEEFVNKKTHPFFCDYYCYLGNSFQKIGNYEMADKYLNKAENLLSGNNINAIYVARTNIYRSLYYQDQLMGSNKELRHLLKAERAIEGYPEEDRFKLFINFSLGYYYHRKKNYKLAVHYFSQDNNKIELALNNTENQASFDPYALLIIHYNLINRSLSYLSLSEENNYNLELLEKSYQDQLKCAKISSIITNEYNFEKSKLYSLVDTRGTYNNIFFLIYLIYMQTGKDSVLNDLFKIAEKSRALMLREYITDEFAKKSAGIPTNLLKKSSSLRKEIDSLQYTLNHTLNITPLENNEVIINLIISKQDELIRFESELERNYPEYLRMKHNEENISINKFQEILQPNQAVLEYLFTNKFLFLLYFDKNNKKVFKTPISIKFPEEVTYYHNLLNNINNEVSDNEKIYEFVEKSYNFYSLMIKPVEDLIVNKHLIIIPDRELNLIPFETLISNKNSLLIENGNFANLPYLILKNPISYAYSAFQLINMRDHPVKDNKKVRFAGFAPEYKPINKRNDPNGPVNSMFPPLPWSRKEIETAHEFYAGKLFVDKHANKQNLIKALDKYDIIHLAMHSLVDMEDPMNSELVFSSDINDNSKQMFAYEVYSHDINAKLIVLSACNTWKGKINKGEGILNMARAFLLAGINNIIVTHWSVADQSSALLMNSFYQYLAEGIPTAEALQKAKIDFLKNGDPAKTHPYYWSGYIYMGNTLTLPASKSHWYYYGIPLSILLLLIGFVTWKKLRP